MPTSEDLWIVVVEPYFDGSHRAWAEGYQTHSAHEVSLLTHTGSFWKWRMHGAALTLAADLAHLVTERGRTPDGVIVSDMIDVAAFRGLARLSLAAAPVVAFFHENQLTYPLAPGAMPDLSYAFVNWLSMASADAIWFNSEFHRSEVEAALPTLLGAMPDHRHGSLIDEVMTRTEVMGIGIDVGPRHDRPDDGGAPIVLWNQRWEYDKDPARFFDAVDRAAARGVEFRLAIAGQNFRQQPAEFEAARRRHAGRIVHFGEADRATYAELLARSDVVVSTARHEFFGLAVAEAVAAGCIPVVPDALAYPELLGDEHADLLYRSDDELDRLLDRALGDAARRRAVVDEDDGPLAQSVRDRLAWPRVARRYDERMVDLVRSSPNRGT